MAIELTPAVFDTIVGTVYRVVGEQVALRAVPRQEFDTLRETLSELAKAQLRSEQRLERVETAIERLTEAQARTEQRVEELAQAQARTEERLTRVEAAIERLTEAQTRTEQRVEELAQAQARTEERLTRVEAAIERLTEAQARSEERLTRVEAAIERLTEAQARSEERLTRVEAAIEQLIATQARNEERFVKIEAAIDRLTAADWRMNNILGGMRGRELERAYRDKAPSYFGRMLRQVRVATIQDVEERLLPAPTLEAFDDLLELDLLVSGRPRHRPDAPEVWLAVEISATLDRGDVERAQRRAAILRNAGLLAIPTVAGDDAVPGLEELAQTEHVLLVQDGRRRFWDEALADVLPL